MRAHTQTETVHVCEGFFFLVRICAVVRHSLRLEELGRRQWLWPSASTISLTWGGQGGYAPCALKYACTWVEMFVFVQVRVCTIKVVA